MFSMGITLTIDDFLRVFKKPDVIGLGFLYCYVAMPALAFVIDNKSAKRAVVSRFDFGWKH